VSLGGKRATIDVICTDFVEDDGSPVVDRVEKKRMRPLNPAVVGTPLSAYVVGTQVDVKSNDCWWESVLTSVEGDVATVKINSAQTRQLPPPTLRPSSPHDPHAPARPLAGTDELMQADATELRAGLTWSAARGWSQRTDYDVQLAAALEAGLPPPRRTGQSEEDWLAEEAAIAAEAAEAEAERAKGGRSSKRARRDRIVYVDGHAVLRINNYTLAGGEPSVFARELGSAEEAHGALARPPKHRKPGRPAKKAASAAPAAASGKAAALPPAEAARQAHNKAVDVARAALAPRRAAFLEAQTAALAPFVSAATLTHIRRMAAAAPKTNKAPPPPCHGPPPQVLATLRPHQTEGLRWLSHMFHSGVNAILADEMGLGKTLQTICLLAHLKYDRRTGGPHLVVCPLSVLSSWMAELKRWCPSLRVVRLHSSDESERSRLRREVLTDPGAFDVAITTYDMVVSANFGAALTSKLHWRCLVLDEGHKAKNEATQVAQALRKVAVNAQYTLLLTGTPLQNNLREVRRPLR